MFKSLKVVSFAAGAGRGDPGSTGNPGLGHLRRRGVQSLAPAPVVATQLSTVSLAPQVQTVYQTVYETVYETEPVTVMETRYPRAIRRRITPS